MTTYRAALPDIISDSFTVYFCKLFCKIFQLYFPCYRQLSNKQEIKLGPVIFTLVSGIVL
jgi:hypothetical protein